MNEGVRLNRRRGSAFDRLRNNPVRHGLVGLTKTTALETAGEGITANAICPGYVLTPLVETQIPDQMKAHGMDRQRPAADRLHSETARGLLT